MIKAIQNIILLLLAIIIATCTAVLFNYNFVVEISNQHMWDKRKTSKTNIDINKKNKIDSLKIDSLKN